MKKVNHLKTRVKVESLGLFSDFQEKKSCPGIELIPFGAVSTTGKFEKGRLRERLTMSKRTPYEMEIHFFVFFIFFWEV